ncbi:hypothetical protein HPB50_017496 [Hyalomma asiaticum]|uniref:Uncharacterized protein n=1 Tax=Hyalomma asiaticum TaxID=266040 RepID=A0ACB7RSL2_HYAAI|nr:hypothetical protein HPB50_017496 [Hyalomma asiaticum]
MDLTSLTKASLLMLAEEFDLDVDEDLPESEIRNIIVESGSDPEDIEYFGTLILINQEREMKERIEDERRRQELKYLNDEIERLDRERKAMQRDNQDRLLREKFPGVVNSLPSAQCDYKYVGENDNFETVLKEHRNDLNEHHVTSSPLAEYSKTYTPPDGLGQRLRAFK